VEERSMNTVYLQPTFNFFAPDGWQISLQPRAWVYVFGVSENNPDIAKFHGYADLLTTISWTRGGTLPWEDRYELATMVHVGSEGNKGSIKVDFSFSLFELFNVTPRFHAQYFAGYEQTLRQYNSISHGYRIGISLFD
jgi:outer membrane phospholipase A